MSVKCHKIVEFWGECQDLLPPKIFAAVLQEPIGRHYYHYYDNDKLTYLTTSILHSSAFPFGEMLLFLITVL